jgi:hypothetical protein
MAWYSRKDRSFIASMERFQPYVTITFLFGSLIQLTLQRAKILWTTMDAFQITNSLLFVNVNLPLNVYKFLRMLSPSQMQFQKLQFNMKSLTSPSPEKFAAEGMLANHLANSFNILCVLSLTWIFQLAISEIILKFELSSFLESNLGMLKEKLLIFAHRSLIVSFFRVMLSALLQLRHLLLSAGFSSLISIANPVLALFTMASLLIYLAQKTCKKPLHHQVCNRNLIRVY